MLVSDPSKPGAAVRVASNMKSLPWHRPQDGFWGPSSHTGEQVNCFREHGVTAGLRSDTPSVGAALARAHGKVSQKRPQEADCVFTHLQRPEARARLR